jgi:hypothetical protein
MFGVKRAPVADLGRAAVHDDVIHPGGESRDVSGIGQDLPAQLGVPAIAQIIQGADTVNARSIEASGECGGVPKAVIDHEMANGGTVQELR